jgi:hypothetical protein
MGPSGPVTMDTRAISYSTLFRAFRRKSEVKGGGMAMAEAKC